MNTNKPVAAQRVLELHNVSKQYGTEPAVHALVDVDLWLDHGDRRAT